MSLGTLDPTVTADVPHFAVFNADAGVNYVFHNPDLSERTIHFSDGRVVTAVPGQSGIYRWIHGASDVSQGEPPSRIVLVGAHPNPFNPRTTIAFEVPRDMKVNLRVYDVAGRMVAELMNDEVAGKGRNEVVWQGEDLDGRPASAGVYFYRLEAGRTIQTKRMTLLK